MARQRSAFHGEADFDGHLPVINLSLVDVATRFDHLNLPDSDFAPSKESTTPDSQNMRRSLPPLWGVHPTGGAARNSDGTAARRWCQKCDVASLHKSGRRLPCRT